MLKFNPNESLDYAFKKTLQAEEELRKYLQTKDNAYLIYCINDLATAIREIVELLESEFGKIKSDIEYLEDRVEDIETRLL